MTIEVIGKPNCPYCDKAKHLLNTRGYDYTYRVIGVDVTRESVMEDYPAARTVPIVVIDGRWIGGFTELNEHLNPKDGTLICG